MHVIRDISIRVLCHRVRWSILHNTKSTHRTRTIYIVHTANIISRPPSLYLYASIKASWRQAAACNMGAVQIKLTKVILAQLNMSRRRKIHTRLQRDNDNGHTHTAHNMGRCRTRTTIIHRRFVRQPVAVIVAPERRQQQPKKCDANDPLKRLRNANSLGSGRPLVRFSPLLVSTARGLVAVVLAAPFNPSIDESESSSIICQQAKSPLSNPVTIDGFVHPDMATIWRSSVCTGITMSPCDFRSFAPHPSLHWASAGE